MPCTRRAVPAGYPSGSIVGYAPDDKGRPVFSFSTMSSHTQDIQKDPRVSLTVTVEGFKVCSVHQSGQGRAGQGRAGQGRAGQGWGRSGAGGGAGQGWGRAGRVGVAGQGQGRAGQGRGGAGQGVG